MSDELKNALQAAFNRYTAYLDAFGPDETYLRKKVETELGTKMIHLKMRCSGLDSKWGKVNKIFTNTFESLLNYFCLEYILLTYILHGTRLLLGVP